MCIILFDTWLDWMSLCLFISKQRSTAGLALPLYAFKGTVSLHAPTGKTLSLSTYEVSSDGLKISPNDSKKVEVYRSKSVGHEPSAEEHNSSTGGVGVGVADTNVKIHLEVLEICDNEEAMDSVSIVSNISQSSTHARSPSLRYSRRENRFVSCDLGETASYSLLIPTSNPDADNINIHIPDTVEAHRQNSRRQRQEAEGYQEEIQLLNEAYRRQAGDQSNWNNQKHQDRPMGWNGFSEMGSNGPMGSFFKGRSIDGLKEILWLRHIELQFHGRLKHPHLKILSSKYN